MSIEKTVVNKVETTLRNCLEKVKNEGVRQQLNCWVINCERLISLKLNDEQKSSQANSSELSSGANSDHFRILQANHGEIVHLAKGSNGRVEKLGEYVIKHFKKFDSPAVHHELNICKSYTQKASDKKLEAPYLIDRKLVMHYIEGSKESVGEVIDAVKIIGGPSVEKKVDASRRPEQNHMHLSH